MCGKKIKCPSQLVPGKRYRLSGNRTSFADPSVIYSEESGEGIFLGDIRTTGYNTAKSGELLFHNHRGSVIGRFAADVMTELLIIEEVPEVKVDYANIYNSSFGSGTYSTAEGAYAACLHLGGVENHIGFVKRTMHDGVIVSLEFISFNKK